MLFRCSLISTSKLASKNHVQQRPEEEEDSRTGPTTLFHLARDSVGLGEALLRSQVLAPDSGNNCLPRDTVFRVRTLHMANPVPTRVGSEPGNRSNSDGLFGRQENLRRPRWRSRAKGPGQMEVQNAQLGFCRLFAKATRFNQQSHCF